MTLKSILNLVENICRWQWLYSIVYAEGLSAQKWARHWKMAFNTDPNKQAVYIFFSQKKSEVTHPQLFSTVFKLFLLITTSFYVWFSILN